MPPQTDKNDFHSSLGIKVFKSRGEHLKVSGDTWLKEKADFDGAEGLWRIHDDLYDFTDFVEHHPGGAMWLELTKGTDITEAFESHHISIGPERLLSKFQIRKAVTPRNSPFTFKEGDFYRQLKKEIRDDLRQIPKEASTKSKLIVDGTFICFVVFALLAAKFASLCIGLVAGICLAFLTVGAHNFFHQKDNFRMFYFDFSTMSSREWRISHALSHHLYTNTIIDLEIQLFEPLLLFLPIKKSFIAKYGSWFYSPILYATVFLIALLRRIAALINGDFKGVGKRFLIPFTIPLIMYIFGGQPLFSTILLWLWIVCVASFQFAAFGVNAAHHRPDVFHDGDTPRGKTIDWGVSQLDACMDRSDITGSHFWVLVSFGDHVLHHLFPTLDHGKLQYLYPTFTKVCKKFGVELRLDSQLNMIKGTMKQLAKEVPNPHPPGYKTK